MESTGQAKAEAQSRAEAAKIEGEAAVEQAKLKSQASKIESVSDKTNDSDFLCGSFMNFLNTRTLSSSSLIIIDFLVSDVIFLFFRNQSWSD